EVLAQHGDADAILHVREVVERSLEAPLLGQHADRARAALLVERGLVRRVGNRGQVAARRARAFDLGDHADRRRPREEPRRVERVGALARRPLDLREGAPGAARLGVLDRTRRELGEERHQWALGWYLGPLTPNPAFDRMKPTIGPRTKSTAAATMSQSCEKNSATVPTASATSMMRTAVQAAGECPWPGSPMGFKIGRAHV